MKVVFMGTPDFAVSSLKRLIQSEYEVVGVYTQPDRPAGRGRKVIQSPVKEAAEKHGIPVFQPAKLRLAEETEKLRALKPDVIVVAAFGQILRQQVLEIPHYGCINVHASLLPRHRGAAPISAAILEGDDKTGVTIMLMDTGMDTGPILSQAEEPILLTDTTGSLSARLARLGADLLMKTLGRWLAGEIHPEAQDDSQATYTRLINKKEGEIDWQEPAVKIWRRVRAFQPWPGCYTYFQGRLLKIVAAMPIENGLQWEPGRVFLLDKPHDNSRLAVGTGDGVLVLRTIQLEGKREMTVEEFLRGQKEVVLTILGRDETKA